MKAGYVALFLLVTAIVCSIINFSWLDDVATRVVADLDKAVVLARAGDLERSQEAFERAERLWQDKFDTLDMTVDGGPLCEGNVMLLAAKSYFQSGEISEYIAQCELASLHMRATIESERITWGNVM